MGKNADLHDSVIQISQFFFLFFLQPFAPSSDSRRTVPALPDNKSRRDRSNLLLTLWVQFEPTVKFCLYSRAKTVYSFNYLSM
jgi:hypothetical protein